MTDVALLVGHRKSSNLELTIYKTSITFTITIIIIIIQYVKSLVLSGVG